MNHSSIHPSTHSLERQDAILAYIIQFKRDNDGLAPSIREIMTAVDLTSSSLVKYYLNRLEKRGKIELIDYQSRGIRVVGGQWALMGMM